MYLEGLSPTKIILKKNKKTLDYGLSFAIFAVLERL